VSSADQTTFTVGVGEVFTVTATGTPVPSVTEKGRLPRGLTFTAGRGTATISGTPAAADRVGSYPVTIEARNGVLPAASQFFTVTVAA
jgi:hypothetical protein